MPPTVSRGNRTWRYLGLPAHATERKPGNPKGSGRDIAQTSAREKTTGYGVTFDDQTNATAGSRCHRHGTVRRRMHCTGANSPGRSGRPGRPPRPHDGEPPDQTVRLQWNGPDVRRRPGRTRRRAGAARQPRCVAEDPYRGRRGGTGEPDPAVRRPEQRIVLGRGG